MRDLKKSNRTNAYVIGVHRKVNKQIKRKLEVTIENTSE